MLNANTSANAHVRNEHLRRRIEYKPCKVCSSACVEFYHPIIHSGLEEGRHVETDQDRRQVLLESVDQQDLDSLKSQNYDFSDGFLRSNDTHMAEPDSSRSVEQSSTVIVSRKRFQTGTPAPLSRKRQRTLHFGNPSSSACGNQESDNMWGCLVCTL